MFIMKKKLAIGLTTATLLAACTGAAFAAPSVTVNGQALQLDQPPLLVESRTMVPMRAIFEALGCDVTWDAAAQTVLAQKELDYISLRIGDKTLYASDGNVQLDVPAQIINGRTLVPLRAVSEALDAKVSWDAATETVTIIGAAQGDYKYETKKLAQSKNNIALSIAYPQFLDRADADNTVLTALNKQLAAAAQSKAVAIQQSFATEAGEVPYSVTVQERFTVPYNQGQYCSILSQTMQDSGGAHPNTARTAVIYDMKAGKALTLNDLLNGEQKDIDQLIHDGFAAQIKAKPEAFFEDAEKLLDKGIADKTYGYYLTEQGLTIFFQPYDIAPYAAGFQEYTIPFNQTDAFKVKF